MKKTPEIKVAEPVKYTPVVFDSQYEKEDTHTRYTRLLTEFDNKLADRLSELKALAEAQLQLDLETGSTDAIKNNQLRKQYFDAYATQSANLKNTILSYSTVSGKREFLSKHFIKKYAGHEFLSERGYPNEKFRIELLARAIKTFDDPEDVENQKQLLLLHHVLPEGTNKIVIALAIAAVVLMCVGVIGIMGPLIPIAAAIGIPMMLAGVCGFYPTMFASAIAKNSADDYKKYKKDTSTIPDQLKFFTQPEMEKSVTPKDVVVKPDQSPKNG